MPKKKKETEKAVEVIKEDQVNIKDEKYVLKLTEWEIDIIGQAVMAAQFPGSVSLLAANLIDKIKVAIDGNSNNVHVHK